MKNYIEKELRKYLEDDVNIWIGGFRDDNSFFIVLYSLTERQRLQKQKVINGIINKMESIAWISDITLVSTTCVVDEDADGKVLDGYEPYYYDYRIIPNLLTLNSMCRKDKIASILSV